MGLVLSALAAALCVAGLQGFSQIMTMGGGLAFVVGVLLDRGRDTWVSGRDVSQMFCVAVPCADGLTVVVAAAWPAWVGCCCRVTCGLPPLPVSRTRACRCLR